MWLCHKKLPTTSLGLWMQGSPLRADLPLLSIQIIFVVVISSIFCGALKPLGIPTIVCQMLTGIMLSPLVLGRIDFFHNLYSLDNTIGFKSVGILGMLLFKFLLGVKIEMSVIKKSGKKALVIGLLGYFVPLVLTFTAYYSFIKDNVSEDHLQNSNLFNTTTIMWSESSLLVVACLLDELKLLNSKIGRLAMAASLIQTTAGICTKNISNGYFGSFKTDLLIAYASLLGIIAFIILVARPVTKWIVKRTPKGELLTEGYFVTIFMLTLLCGFLGTVLGVSAGMSMFFLGLALPSGPPVGSTLVERLEGIVTALCFPVFVVVVTMGADFTSFFRYIVKMKNFILIDLVITLMKAGVAAGTAVYCRMPFFDVITLVLILSARGVAEVAYLHQWQDDSLDMDDIYTTYIFQLLFWAAITAPLIKYFYKPSNRYLGYKRRTIQQAKNNVELRILTCIYTEDHVPSAIKLLETLCTTQDQPICVYVLHLVELVGRVITVLLPYRKGKDSLYTSASTDQIITAFQNFEQKMSYEEGGGGGVVTLQPFVSMSPYGSMYDDICSLALDKKVSMVVLPFHKMGMVNGAIETTNHALQDVNTSVLTYAPCTVGIFVDHSNIDKDSNIQNVMVYFFGGPDDREALRLAIRMACNPRIQITLVRFMSKIREMRYDKVEEKYDNEVLYEFRVLNNRRNMVYVEEAVCDSEEVVNVIRTTSQGADLLIVGRREGKESMLVEGLLMWSEYPELGVIGDMLASKDFDSQVSTLVVQQQPARKSH